MPDFHYPYMLAALLILSIDLSPLLNYELWRSRNGVFISVSLTVGIRQVKEMKEGLLNVSGPRSTSSWASVSHQQ